MHISSTSLLVESNMRTPIFVGLLAVLLATTLSYSNAEDTLLVSGKSECLDCAEKNVKNELAYQGLQVSIKCKTSNGDYETKGTSKLDDEGNYNIQLPAKLIRDKSECFAQLHSVSNALCPHIKNEPNPSKIVLGFEKDGAHTFSTSSKLPFSVSTCTSAFLWPHWKPCPPSIPIYMPPVPIYKPVYKPVPIYKPPVPIYKPVYKPVPIYKPVYKPVPIYKPPVPIYKPVYKPVPIYKPPVPIYIPVPIYKKPCPPLVPVPTPSPPVYTKPTHPLLQFPPIYKKPFHHFPKYPPMYEKPLPPHT